MSNDRTVRLTQTFCRSMNAMMCVVGKDSMTFRPTLVRPYQFGPYLFFRRVGRMGWAEQPSIRPSTFSFGSWAEWAGPNSPVFDPVLGENIISTRHLGSPTPLISKAEPGVGMGLDNYKEVHYPNLHRKRRQVMA